jgi:hypothetical protein
VNQIVTYSAFWNKLSYIYNSVDFHRRAAVSFILSYDKKLKNKLPLIMQILGILLFIAGDYYGKGNLLPFLIGCFTGLKSDLQGK